MSELTGKIWHLMDSRREPGEHFVPRSKPLILKDFFKWRRGWEPISAPKLLNFHDFP